MIARQQRILVAQIGARRHYAVPLALQAEGLLERFYTDACAELPPWNLLHRAWPRFLPLPQALKGLQGRNLSAIPLERLTGFPWFALSAQWDRRPGEHQTDRWARRNARFCKLAVLEGLEGADTVYAFNGAALELFKEARRFGLRTVLDQTAAPWRWNSSLLLEERLRWPGWEDQPAEIDLSGWLSWREEREWELADHIICGSAFARDALQQTANQLPSCSVVPYPSGAKPVTLSPLEAREESQIKKENHDEFRVLFVGTLQLRKGLPYLLEALRLLSDSRLQVRLVGPSLLSSRAMDELSSCCELIGPVARSEIHHHYQWADAFVLPTLSEGSANVVYEALSAALPVITTPAAGSIVQDRLDGLLVPTRSGLHLAEALKALQQSSQLRRQLSLNAMHSLSANDWTRYQKNLVSAVNETNLLSPCHSGLAGHVSGS